MSAMRWVLAAVMSLCPAVYGGVELASVSCEDGVLYVHMKNSDLLGGAREAQVSVAYTLEGGAEQQGAASSVRLGPGEAETRFVAVLRSPVALRGRARVQWSEKGAADQTRDAEFQMDGGTNLDSRIIVLQSQVPAHSRTRVVDATTLLGKFSLGNPKDVWYGVRLPYGPKQLENTGGGLIYIKELNAYLLQPGAEGTFEATLEREKTDTLQLRLERGGEVLVWVRLLDIVDQIVVAKTGAHLPASLGQALMLAFQTWGGKAGAGASLYQALQDPNGPDKVLGSVGAVRDFLEAAAKDDRKLARGLEAAGLGEDALKSVGDLLRAPKFVSSLKDALAAPGEYHVTFKTQWAAGAAKAAADFDRLLERCRLEDAAGNEEGLCEALSAARAAGVPTERLQVYQTDHDTAARERGCKRCGKR